MEQDRSIVCGSCGADFLFSASERAFYEERGFVPPKRCKPCREARGAKRGEPKRGWETSCARCGSRVILPFEPRPNGPRREIFCPRCWRGRHGVGSGPTSADDAGIIE
jgi:CxxC-x17-CxxC domain-containing protein